MVTEVVRSVFYVEKRIIHGETEWALFVKGEDAYAGDAWAVYTWDKEPTTAEVELAEACAMQAMRFVLHQLPSYVPRRVPSGRTEE